MTKNVILTFMEFNKVSEVFPLIICRLLVLMCLLMAVIFCIVNTYVYPIVDPYNHFLLLGQLKYSQ